jgi:hypothetical protein
MAAQLGGRIAVCSTVGVGSTFTLYLPVAWHGPVETIAPDQAVDNAAVGWPRSDPPGGEVRRARQPARQAGADRRRRPEERWLRA